MDEWFIPGDFDPSTDGKIWSVDDPGDIVAVVAERPNLLCVSVLVGEQAHTSDVLWREAVRWDQASECQLSVSPHAIRRGAITNHLNSDVPENVVGDRANVSKDVLDQHYDQRTERERMEQQRGYLDSV